MTKSSSSARRSAWRLGLSVLLVFHLVALFAPPLAFQARGPVGRSPAVESLVAPVRRYGEFLYLNRGYAFFAPDPGPSHLIQAAITDPSGERIERMYPDLDRQWPRLLYHRHFMLAEFLNDAHRPPGPPEELAEIDRGEYESWRLGRSRYEHLRRSIVEHLQRKHPGHEVAIRRIEHALPGFIEFNADNIRLDDERLYNVLLDQPLEAAEGEQAAGRRDDSLPSASPEAIPTPPEPTP